MCTEPRRKLSSDSHPLRQTVELSPVAIACGARHTAALLDNGVAFAWGENVNGQCGGASRSPRSRKRNHIVSLIRSLFSNGVSEVRNLCLKVPLPTQESGCGSEDVAAEWRHQSCTLCGLWPKPNRSSAVTISVSKTNLVGQVFFKSWISKLVAGGIS